MIDKSKLTIRERVELNWKLKEYQANPNCEFIDVIDGCIPITEDKSFLRSDNDNDFYTDIFDITNFNNLERKNKIKDWEMFHILSVTNNNDVIVILDGFYIKLKLINVEAFFSDFIDKIISNYVGLSIYYFNESKKFTQFFSESEYQVEYLLKEYN